MKEKFAQLDKAIRLLFWLFAAACLIAAIAMPDRGQMVEGMLRLCTTPYQSANSYFDPAVGGFAGTFLNAAVICAICADGCASAASERRWRSFRPSALSRPSRMAWR